jgi:ATP-dependent Lhr-like helicase
MDPANPYGALVPWPAVADAERAKPRRVAGAWLILARGRPVLYVAPRGGSLLSFPGTIRDEEGALDSAIEALRTLPKGSARGLLVIRTIDGLDVADSPLADAFRRAGFVSDYRGLVDARPPGTPAGRQTG